MASFACICLLINSLHSSLLAAVTNAKAVGKSEALDTVCKLPQDAGPCRAMVKRWSYDTSKSGCIEFYYGGCRGNANNFESKEACEAKCSMRKFFSSICSIK